MKKPVRKIVIVINCVIFFTLVIGMTAFAGDKTVSLTAGKWFSCNEEFYNTTYLKISIPRDGYITVLGSTLSNSLSKEFNVDVSLCESSRKPLNLCGSWATRMGK